MSLVIKISDLAKIYRLGEIGTGTISLDLERWFKMKIMGQEDPFLKIGEINERTRKGNSNLVYSLREINLEVQEGESLGIIGRNGAGKSTLLKIISRVTSPSKGIIRIKGRIASLLEVGTGFHPELTGRENIYLNGAILGMRKREITNKLEEIIDFSGIERYIDTPVKRYSSGMYVRLAFAVAAHLESEIIIVDEVLAVGDAEFQKKCLGKMGQVSKSEGRTVLFVSHNMAAISSLCTRVIVLKDGQISFTGEVESGIDHYLDNPDIVRGFAILHDKKSKWWKQPRAFSKLLSVETLNNKEESQRYFMMGSCMKIKISFEITDDREDVEVGIFFLDHRENTIGLLSSAAEGFIDFRKGINVYQIDIPEIKLMPGEYVLGIWIVHQREVDDAFEHALSIEILADNFTGNYVDYNRFKGYGSIIRSNWYNITQE